MFWSTELLSRRDSGFGLAWLAATLGAKSSFSKLPKRSVMAANITQMCNLIAEPPEPLALRLSSNLMIGVTRVYKVKQEILLTDITTCFNMLKRAFQDAYVTSSANAQLQMAQPTVRPDTVTLTANPIAAYTLDFDNLFADWDERNKGEDEEADDSDDEFGVKKKGKKKGKAKATPVSQVEQGLHTLQEHNDFMLSSSFDASFGADGFGGLVPSSSQVGGYGYNDNFLEGLDLGADIGAELAKELGDGWGMPADHPGSDDVNTNVLDIDMGLPGDMDVDFRLGGHSASRAATEQPIGVGFSPNLKRPFSDVDNDMIQPDGSVIVPFSPVGSQAEGGQEPSTKKPRRVRLLLDARTELTNEELERARAHYLEGQAELRREHAQKKAERDGMKMLEEMVWGAPRGINAPALIQFWEENFKLQVEARSAHPVMEVQDRSRRTRQAATEIAPAPEEEWGRGLPEDRMDLAMNFGDAGLGIHMGPEELDLNSRMRSSEEPGQARRGSSRPPSVLGSNFGLGTKLPDSGSQRSNMFPWDNAGGVTSSISGVAFGAGGSDRLSLVRADSRIRRSSSLPKGSVGGVPESPASFLPSGSHAEFDFAVPTQLEDDPQIETQATDVSMMSLEKNSSNFLEYMKIQVNALPTGAAALKFEDVVPKDTSTRHVAAAAFYHCLVLSTKDLIGIQQSKPYSMLRLTVK